MLLLSPLLAATRSPSSRSCSFSLRMRQRRLPEPVGGAGADGRDGRQGRRRHERRAGREGLRPGAARVQPGHSSARGPVRLPDAQLAPAVPADLDPPDGAPVRAGGRARPRRLARSSTTTLDRHPGRLLHLPRPAHCPGPPDGAASSSRPSRPGPAPSGSSSCSTRCPTWSRRPTPMSSPAIDGRDQLRRGIRSATCARSRSCAASTSRCVPVRPSPSSAPRARGSRPWACSSPASTTSRPGTSESTASTCAT